MKKSIFILAIVAILWSCNSDDKEELNTNVVGNWKLTEILIDPGDDSGVFTPVDSQKTITFASDGAILSNGDLCDISIDIEHPTSGTYSISPSTFSSPDCDDPNRQYTFEQSGNILIIHYPCIEACKAKYIKL